MTDQTLDQTGPPRQFHLPIPAWWPRIEVLDDLGDRVPDELEPEQQQAVIDMVRSVGGLGGTKVVSVMMTAEDTPRVMGLMYINYSDQAANLLSGLLGMQATPDEIPELRSVGKLKDTEVSVVHFDTVGAVSCITARRANLNEHLTTQEALIRAYVVPKPSTLKAVLVVFTTTYHEQAKVPFSDLCDDIMSGFNWRW